MSDSDMDDPAPLEARPPPTIHATPADVRPSVDPDADPERITWWRPSWRDAARHVGWRWVFLLPAVALVLLMVAAAFFRGLRGPVIALGVHVAAFVGAVAFAMAGYVWRCAARARAEPFCIHCGYDLSGLPDNYRCPECGRPYTWRLIAEYRRDPEWFQERWKLHRHLPPSDAPIDAGPVRRRRRSRDGTS
jgi:hypothetical protein